MTISSGRDATMAEPDPQAAPKRRPRVSKKQARKVGRHAVRLTGREYAPMALTIAFWAIVALGIGHADAARLLATTVLMRGPLMLSQMSTNGPLRRRLEAPKEVWKTSKRLVNWVQLGVLVSLAVQVAILVFVLRAIDQDLVAGMLPLVCLGYPAKLHRAATPGLASPFVRMFLGVSAVIAAGIAWTVGAGPLGFALAYGLRDWLTSLLMLLALKAPMPTGSPTDQPLTFGEVAQATVVSSRRLMTYRVTKNVLTVFGPFGNFAARTGRGLNLHSRLEPLMPHKRGGFIFFALLTAAIAVVLAMRSGKPLAMVAGAGAIQLSALSINVLLWWRYLPDRADPNLVVDEEEDDS